MIHPLPRTPRAPRASSVARAWLGALLLAAAGCPNSATPPPASPAPSPSASPAVGSHAVSRRAPRGTIPALANVVVSGGEFVMGSEGGSAGGMDCERPRTSRHVGSFTIDVYEVTNAAYAAFLASPDSREHVFCHPEEPLQKDHAPATPSSEERGWGAVADPFGDPQRAQHPVVGVDWWDAYAFAAWVGRRLPSETEWERAARGTDGRTYPWGEEPIRDGLMVRATAYDPEQRTMTTRVGARQDGRAPSGALDMAGNVWEWTESPFLNYSGAPEGEEDRPAERVLRGGGWNSASPFLLRTAMRHSRPRDYRSAALGFRTAGDPDDRRQGGS